MLKLLVFVSILFSSNLFAEFEKTSFPINSIQTINIENSSGGINVFASTAKDIVVELEKVRFPDSCKLEMVAKSDNLSIKVDENRKDVDHESCIINFRIQVPENMNLFVRNGFGPLDVLGLKGSVDYNIGFGDVQLDGHFSELIARNGSGDITLRGFSEKTIVRSGKGGLKFYSNRPLELGTLDIKNGTGDVELFVPESSELAVKFSSGIGTLSHEFPLSKKEQSFKVLMKSGTGALRIKKK